VGEDDPDSRVVVVGEPLVGGGELRDRLEVEGVALLRPVHADEEHVTVPLDRHLRRIRLCLAHRVGTSSPPPPTFSAATNASWGISTEPSIFMRFFPSFWRSSSLRFRVMSPP
jgi:hypothetical protein